MPRFTIWRGAKLLGEIWNDHLPTPNFSFDSSVWLLQPAPGAQIEGLMQMEYDLPTKLPIPSIQQRPLRPVFLGVVDQRGNSVASAGNNVTVKRTEALPPDLILEVRDGEGKPVRARMISIQQVRLPAYADAREYRATNGLPGESPDLWTADFSESLPGNSGRS